MMRSVLLLISVGVLASCEPQDATVSIPDAGFVQATPDASVRVDGGVPGCQPPGPPSSVTLDPLAEVCQQASAGWRSFLIETGRVNATLCGEVVEDGDIPHLRTSGITDVELEPNCTSSAMAHELSRLEPSVQLGRVVVHRDRIAQCQALRQGPLDEPNTAQGRLRPECRIMEGVGAIGDPCDVHEECAEFFCRPTGDRTCGGVCAARVATGGTCTPGKDRCAAGSCRDTGGRNFRCVALAMAGESCGDAVSCGSDTFCSEGRCEDHRGEGGACVRGGDQCGAGLVCVVADSTAQRGTCRRRAAEGERCGDSRDGNPPCADRCLRCSDRCVRLGIDGDPCSAQTDCVEDAYCDPSGTCRPRPRRGAPCQLTADLPRGNCAFVDDFCQPDAPESDAPESDDGVCTASPALCESCDESLSCAAGRCQFAPHGGRFCFPKPDPPPRVGAPLGAACQSNGECLSSFCNPASDRCTIECTSGCQGNLLDTYGFLIFYGLVINVRRRRARS